MQILGVDPLPQNKTHPKPECSWRIGAKFAMNKSSGSSFRKRGTGGVSLLKKCLELLIYNSLGGRGMWEG